MVVKVNILEGNNAKTDAEQLVCPFIGECLHFHLCNQPDFNYLRYIIEFCGNRYLNCQHIRGHLNRRVDSPDQEGQAAHATRAGPD